LRKHSIHVIISFLENSLEKLLVVQMEELKLFSKPVSLIGFMGAGKTSVGKRLAEIGGLPFFDLDAMIEEETKLSISEIFSRHGEAVFRKIESQALERLLTAKKEGVFSLGGGVVLMPQNRKMIKDFTFAVWLNIPSDILLERIKSDSCIRPLAIGISEAELLTKIKEREIPYRETAHLEITETGSPLEVAKTIREKLLNQQKEGKSGKS